MRRYSLSVPVESIFCLYHRFYLQVGFFFSWLIGEPTGTSVSPASPVPQSFTAKRADMGLDTAKELADMEKFFHEVEGGASPIDYNKKLGEMSASYSVTGNSQNR